MNLTFYFIKKDNNNYFLEGYRNNPLTLKQETFLKSKFFHSLEELKESFPEESKRAIIVPKTKE